MQKICWLTMAWLEKVQEEKSKYGNQNVHIQLRPVKKAPKIDCFLPFLPTFENKTEANDISL